MITILGCCRQDSIKDYFPVTSIRDRLNYCHYANEALQVIKYISGNFHYKSIPSNVFRYSLLSESVFSQKSFIKEYENTSLFVWEIATLKEYVYQDWYCHEEIANKNKFNKEIVTRTSNYRELEDTILKMIDIVGKSRLLIVSHIYTHRGGSRHLLAKKIEKICEHYGIAYLNPMEFIKPEFYSEFFIDEPVLAHYTKSGERYISEIYRQTIKNFFNIKPYYKKAGRIRKKINSLRGRF
jgi:hypothetical protein